MFKNIFNEFYSQFCNPLINFCRLSLDKTDQTRDTTWYDGYQRIYAVRFIILRVILFRSVHQPPKEVNLPIVRQYRFCSFAKKGALENATFSMIIFWPYPWFCWLVCVVDRTECLVTTVTVSNSSRHQNVFEIERYFPLESLLWQH